MTQLSPQAADPMAQTWATIERLVEQASRSARLDQPPSEFYQQLLDRCVSALSAQGAAVWIDRGGVWQLDQRVGLTRDELAVPLHDPAHLGLLRAVAGSGGARVVLPGGPSAVPGQSGNPTGWMLVLCPVVLDESPIAVLEVFQRPTADAELQQAYANVLSALAEAAAEFQRNAELRDLRSRRLGWEQSQQFAQRVHRCRSVRETAYTIANEGRRLLACDRLSVVACRGRRAVLLAVSGVERIQRRSVSVRCLERIAALVSRTREPLRYEGSAAELPAELERWLHAYVEETDVRSMIVQPLLDSAQRDADERPAAQDAPRGALIVERFDAERDDERAALLGTVCAHSQIALRNAQQRRSALGRAVDWLGQRGRWAKMGLALSLIALLVIAASLIPADFEIQARGQLLPEVRFDVFAPRDGEIQQLLVEHDQLVEQGQEVARLSSVDLDLELKRLSGELQTTEQKLLAARTERIRSTAPTAEDRRTGASWSALEKELEKQAESLRDQLQLVRAETERLSVRSPIRGRIQTWDVQRLLEARPVTQGQVLMTVADVDGPWVVELEIPDHHIAHVLAARDESGDLPVRFVLKTDPGTTSRGAVQTIGMTTVQEDQGRPHVKAVVGTDRQAIGLLRSGAAVVARIHCGRRSLGYVWLHDLIDAVRTWLLF